MEPRNSCEEIAAQVAWLHGLTFSQLRKPGRRNFEVRRIVAQATRRAGYSLPAIGRAVNRHHTTVLAALATSEEKGS